MGASGVPFHRRRCCCFVVLLFLHASSILFSLASEEPHLGASCGSLSICHGGEANKNCCKAINTAIMEGGCSCACTKLSRLATRGLIGRCADAGTCTKCQSCRRVCAYMEGAYLTSL
ncbi:unnamed protein product [Spirodela intermedia]|uniref:Uncharacterized protein n=1 Tax=Spirodela intermedia TaxID=51605 RepID=A0A7I8L0K5_SPIIN|nr:unnamed protein product [Spirodela intermedia]